MAIIKSQAAMQKKQRKDEKLGLSGAAMDASDSDSDSESSSSGSDSDPSDSEDENVVEPMVESDGVVSEGEESSDPDEIPLFPAPLPVTLSRAISHPTFSPAATPHITLCVLCLNKEFRTPEAVKLHLSSSVHSRSAKRFSAYLASDSVDKVETDDPRVIAFITYRDAQRQRENTFESASKKKSSKKITDGKTSNPKIIKSPLEKKAAKEARILRRKALKASKKARRLDRKSSGTKTVDSVSSAKSTKSKVVKEKDSIKKTSSKT